MATKGNLKRENRFDFEIKKNVTVDRQGDRRLLMLIQTKYS
jgi:hypothetical protein